MDKTKDSFTLPKKRTGSGNSSPQSSRKRRRLSLEVDQNKELDLNTLGNEILSADRKYNRIIDILKIAQDDESQRIDCLSVLYKVFSSLLLDGRLRDRSRNSESENAVTHWLIDRYQQYKEIACRCLMTNEGDLFRASVSIILELAKAEAESKAETRAGRFSSISTISDAILTIFKSSQQNNFEIFINSFIAPFWDLRFTCVERLIDYLEKSKNRDSKPIERIIFSLSAFVDREPRDESQQIFSKNFSDYCHVDRKFTAPRIGQCWLSVLKLPLKTQERREIIKIIPRRIAPYIAHPELLLDFLTESCRRGGTDTLIALGGLRHLVSDHKLDYPQIYTWLYSAVGANTLHKKHKSDTIRLLDSFFSSTHLPSALIASFLKKLARLCLYSPPSAIVSALPFIYNTIQTHRACSVQLHRSLHARSGLSHDEVFEDQFNAEESDPLLTGAIESSLWELESLISHWHPNVAAVSRIIAEQFLKQSYNLEHFLDHSYGTLFETEIRKPIIKEPNIEPQIPMSIFRTGNEFNNPRLTLGLRTFHKDISSTSQSLT